MYGKTILCSQSGKGQVLRVLSCECDGLIVYTWKYPESEKNKSLSFIRCFDAANNTDKVVLVWRGRAEVIHGSLSEDRLAIAFTVWYQPGQMSGKESVFEVVTDIDQGWISELEAILPFLYQPPQRTETLDDNVIPDSAIGCLSSPTTSQRGIYRSYVAQTHCTGWFMKFTGHKLSREDKERYNFRGPDERLLQKPIFTNFYERNSAGDIILSSYKIIFLTHKHTIGLYSLVLGHDLLPASEQPPNQPETHHRSRIYSKPESEVLAEKVIWSQWDALAQRLYYLVPARIAKNFPNKKSRLFRLVCLQFFTATKNQQVFDAEVDLDISLHTSKNPSSPQSELDPTVSSRDLNARICTFLDSGAVCLCWQELPSLNTTQRWSYSIALLHKDILIRRSYQKGESMAPISFCVVGQNLLVHSPGSFVHVYEVDSITCENEQMNTGLYHLSMKENRFPPLEGLLMEYLMPRRYFHDHSDASDYSTNPPHNSAVCFDRSTKSLLSLAINSTQFQTMFFDKNLTIQNRIFLTRQSVWLTKDDDFATDCLVECIRYIKEDPADVSVTALISQLIIAQSHVKLLEPKHGVPILMTSLFPLTLPVSSLNKLIPIKEQNNRELHFDFLESRTRMKLQIEEYVSSLLELRRSMLPVESNVHRAADCFDLYWLRSLHACDTASHTEYNLECIRDELILLEAAYDHPGALPTEEPFEQKENWTPLQGNLQRKLRSSKNEIGIHSSSDVTSNDESYDSVMESLNECPQTWLGFLNDHEKDIKSENVLVLTYIKLCDHLSAYCKAVEQQIELKKMARNYVHVQIQVVHSTMNLIVGHIMSQINYDLPLYIRASSSEQELLLALNQFQLACEITCFPLPNGFHTFITWLTFRSILAKHSSDQETSSFPAEQMGLMAECFFDYVDRRLIQLTDEFVLKVLRELGEKEMFGSIIDEVLKRTRPFDSRDGIDCLQLLQDRRLKVHKYFVKAYLKRLYQRQGMSFSSHNGIRSKSFAMPKSVSLQSEGIQQSVDSRRRSEMIGRRSENIGWTTHHIPKVGFQPLDDYLNFVRRSDKDFPQDGVTEKIPSLIKESVIQQAG